MDAITNGVTIKVGSSSFHSFNDFRLAIGNTDYISEPEYEDIYVDIPGRQGFLDLSEVIAGRPVYHSREISIEFGGVKANPNDWDAAISDLRNKFHGKIVQLIFDNDPDWYWTGRAEINDFEHERQLGTFKFEIPSASPFKYSINVVPNLSNLSLSTTGRSISIPVTGQPVNPEFVISNTGTSTVTISATGKPTKTVNAVGTYRWPDLWYDTTTTIVAQGPSAGKISVVYRQMSL